MTKISDVGDVKELKTLMLNFIMIKKVTPSCCSEAFEYVVIIVRSLK